MKKQILESSRPETTPSLRREATVSREALAMIRGGATRVGGQLPGGPNCW